MPDSDSHLFQGQIIVIQCLWGYFDVHFIVGDALQLNVADAILAEQAEAERTGGFAQGFAADLAFDGDKNNDRIAYAQCYHRLFGVPWQGIERIDTDFNIIQDIARIVV